MTNAHRPGQPVPLTDFIPTAALPPASVTETIECLRAALRCLQREEELVTEAWVYAGRDRSDALAVARLVSPQVLTSDDVEVAYDRRVQELIGRGLYRDSLTEHLHRALQALAP